MDEQRPLPPLEELYTQVSKDAFGNNERLGAVATAAATAAEAFVSVAAPVRQQREDTNATKPVVEHRTSLNVPTEGLRLTLRISVLASGPVKGAMKAEPTAFPMFGRFDITRTHFLLRYIHVPLCSICSVTNTSSGSTCVPQSDRQSVDHRTMMSTETRTEKSPVSRIYADQPSSDTLRTYEAHASASMEEHRWSVSDMGCASDAAILRDSGAERGSPITYEVIDDGNSTLPSETGVNAGWGPPLSAIALPNSYMPEDNSTGDHTTDAWYSMPWATEPYSWETLPASFWGWTWSQADNLTASETDGFSHSSIPAPQAAGWSFGGEAEQPQYPTRSGIMHFWGDGSQGLYHPSPSFDAPDPIPSSNALGLSSILETVPPSFPRFPHVQHVEEASLALPTESPMLIPPWDPLAPVSAALPKTDFHRHRLHQQPSPPVPGTEVSPFDNIGANRQESSCHVTMPEDQVEHRHST
ncbi:hypothetical protein BDQ94DRAFT_177484 [Aspergillus welwitschiae]|uniref:Uncharacterized protein n=1 Tax=Aspergillus welwitschiae TaxID=1341132 RepID=A0A3F3PHV0_9EURO|nr:hypothetical protein BDQ94DRAFT_177484 [Aspergillus welwitschiae]RDH26531.1 hypothetical protein BDQ94DRAFT_177484 [Aspergillus welwitschiae]